MHGCRKASLISSGIVSVCVTTLGAVAQAARHRHIKKGAGFIITLRYGVQVCAPLVGGFSDFGAHPS
jgi:hypothetical protein